MIFLIVHYSILINSVLRWFNRIKFVLVSVLFFHQNSPKQYDYISHLKTLLTFCQYTRMTGYIILALILKFNYFEVFYLFFQHFLSLHRFCALFRHHNEYQDIAQSDFSHLRRYLAYPFVLQLKQTA